MKLSKIEKLTNFCNKIIIQNSNNNRGLCAYFEYKDIQYYASFIFIQDCGPDFAVFPALDRSVKSWNYVYHSVNAEELCRKSFREEVFNFLSTLS